MFFFALLFTKIIYLVLNKKYSITNIQKVIKYLRLSKVGDNNIWELKGESIIAKKMTELLDIQIDKTVVNGNDIRNIVKNCKIKI